MIKKRTQSAGMESSGSSISAGGFTGGVNESKSVPWLTLNMWFFKSSMKGIPSVFTCFIPSAAGYSPGCDRWTLQRSCQDAQQVSTNEPDEKRYNQSLGQILHILSTFFSRTKMRYTNSRICRPFCLWKSPQGLLDLCLRLSCNASPRSPRSQGARVWGSDFLALVSFFFKLFLLFTPEDQVELWIAAALVRPEHDRVRRLVGQLPQVEVLVKKLTSTIKNKNMVIITLAEESSLT